MTEPKQSFTEEVQKEAEKYCEGVTFAAMCKTDFHAGAEKALSILSRGGEGREILVYETLVKGKPQLGFAYDPTDELPEGRTWLKFVEYSALVAERARTELQRNKRELDLKTYLKRNLDLESEITTLRAQLAKVVEQRNERVKHRWCEVFAADELNDENARAEISELDRELQEAGNQKKGQGDE